MHALRVRINDEAPVLAGADDRGVLHAAVTWGGKLGGNSHSGRKDEPANLFITVGGLTSRASDVPDEHLNWISQRPLKIGDVISVEVVDSLKVDAPICGKEAEKHSMTNANISSIARNSI